MAVIWAVYLTIGWRQPDDSIFIEPIDQLASFTTSNECFKWADKLNQTREYLPDYGYKCYAILEK